MRFVVFTIVLLTLMYALVLGSFALPDLVMGVGISGALVFLTRRLTFKEKPASTDLPRRFLYFWPFFVAEVWNIVTGTWSVALVTLHIRPLVSPGIVAVPIGDRTPAGVAISSMATTLSPGTFLVDVDWENDVMLIHCIDATDPDEVRREHQEFYRKWQSRVFP